MKIKIGIVLFLGGVIGLMAQSHYPGQHQDKLALKDNNRTKAMAFDMKDVTLLDSRFKENMQRESNWILSLKTNSLLHSFRTNAGVYSGYEGGYDTTEKLGGWESLDCELRGHAVGHILSGLSLLYATTKEDVYKTKADSIVIGLAEVQKVLNQNDYLSAYPQNLIDRNIAGKRVWAPWYTLHKLYAGLIDQYLYTDNKLALHVVEGMANWAYDKLQLITPEQRTIMLRNEFGGMNDVFYSLYEITGNKKYKWLGEFFYHNESLDPLKQKVDNLNKKHANTYIPKLIGLIRDYEIEGNKENKEVTEFFWNTVVNHHSFVTGSNSDKEKFFKPDHQTEHLSGYTGESCNVYNMLKLTRHLFGLEADVKYADFYEKALYNHILGQQDPATGMVAYFLPMLPGAHKVYSTPSASFWCCVGTGFENQAKYSEAIYYHNNKGVFVNLFIPSELNWKEKGFVLKQETKFPYDDKTTLTISVNKNVKTALYVRYPSWATLGATVKVNGKKIRVKSKPGSYINIDRVWKNNDKIEITFPMELHWSNSKEDSDVRAVMYGPIVMAAELGTEGMKKPAPYSNPQLHNDYYTYNYNVPTTLNNHLEVKGDKIKKWLEPVHNKPLTFKSVGLKNKELTFIPLFDLHRERYNIYWDLK
ncbi:glycoside hydrolase family 127 protein [Formosa haliotis]|uniref:glycoside hydrolase family 127 protein n=1 Tax=Formosa haliotis TaxID=1555194 RepID=UPI0008257B55|nr:glycoside hydrolase family 127 protein [Formosa haliotis]